MERMMLILLLKTEGDRFKAALPKREKERGKQGRKCVVVRSWPLLGFLILTTLLYYTNVQARESFFQGVIESKEKVRWRPLLSAPLSHINQPWSATYVNARYKVKPRFNISIRHIANGLQNATYVPHWFNIENKKYISILISSSTLAVATTIKISLFHMSGRLL